MGYRNKEEALASIRRNIEEHGVHVYIVSQGTAPRFAYTIGLHETVGKELVLAGAVAYEDADEILRIINSIAGDLRKRMRSTSSVFRLGKFELRDADASWTHHLLLGAFDYYKPADIHALQIVPDENTGRSMCPTCVSRGAKTESGGGSMKNGVCRSPRMLSA